MFILGIFSAFGKRSFLLLLRVHLACFGIVFFLLFSFVIAHISFVISVVAYCAGFG